MSRILTRRRLLAAGVGSAALTLGGCDFLGDSPTFRDLVLGTGSRLAYRVHRLIGASAMAREYDPSEMSPEFRTNGNTMPRSETYARHLDKGFANWKLEVGGLVEAPAAFSLAELQAIPSRTQITRHDCVEGWSAIGQWTGTPLAHVLDTVRLKPDARFIVFHCADEFTINLSREPYYESVDLIDAFHPQTILAHGMNGGSLPVSHGAPVRLRVERQLGYKHAKFVMRIEAVASLSGIGGGKGGFWEDLSDYDWYAGI